MIKRFFAPIILCSVFSLSIFAQTENSDSIKDQNLHEIVVEASLQNTSAHKTTYIPTTRQKKASQTGSDLIDQISIPQLRVTLDGNIQTSSGKSVAVFIDFIPANDNDLKAMRMDDVKRVEYYENPSDSRLQGNQYVVNYIMAKYEYGGYAKGFGFANIMSYTEQLVGNARLQYKKMTYDILGNGSATSNRHNGSDITETFCLPQADGETKVFNRYSKTNSSKEDSHFHFAAFKATYNTYNIQASSQISGRIGKNPHSDKYGSISYSPSDFEASDFASTLNSATKFLSYNGYYFFRLPKGNSITFSPSYTYTHTEQSHTYTEAGYTPILNNATDNTNQLKALLKMSHSFGKYGNLLGLVNGSYETYRTHYTGTTTALDKTKATQISAGVNYNISIGNFYGLVGYGNKWHRLRFGDNTTSTSAPWIDLSMQYGLHDKHSMAFTLHYSTWPPSSNLKSGSVFQSSHLLYYTGNPDLRPSKSYDLSLRYTWLPDNNFNMGVFANAWIVGDRYVYDYEATASHILRTIKQPMGSYTQGEYGISGTKRLLNSNLVIYTQLSHYLLHNGQPYDFNRSSLEWYAQAKYYLSNWNFTLAYNSSHSYSDGYVNGIWTRSKSLCYFSIGWYNTHWNLRANFINPTRWNWRSTQEKMHSKHYSTTTQYYDTRNHALIQISATYTIGFGKKVNNNNEPNIYDASSSGILH